MLICHPSLDKYEFFNSQCFSSLVEFKVSSDVFISNRIADELDDVAEKHSPVTYLEATK